MQKNSFILNWWIRHPLQMRMESHRLQMTSSHELTLMSYKEEVEQFSKNLLWSKTWYKLTLYIYRIWKFRAISEQGAHWAEKQTRSKNSWRVCLAWISTVWKQKKLLVSQLEKHLKNITNCQAVEQKLTRLEKSLCMYLVQTRVVANMLMTNLS